MKKIDPDGRTYEKLANQLARSNTQIHPCGKCGRPVIHGYCCGTCGDSMPSWSNEQEAAWENKYVKSASR